MKEVYKEFFKERISKIAELGLYRKLWILEGMQSHRIKREGKEVIQFSSNNYLGLTSHPAVKKKAIKIIEEFGCGSASSRLVSGNLLLYKELEERLAQFKQTPAALVFNSGYMANLGVIPSLMGEGDIIFSDELNHASIIDACRLSRAEICIYPHRDVEYLENLLRKTKGKKKLIVTEGVFSMEGDIAPLPDIAFIAERYSAMLMVDDAHGTGVLGEQGRGTIEHFGLQNKVDIQMGTLSKALGGIGGFIAGDKILIDYLINTARTFIFTTALPPSVLSSAIAALEVICEEPNLRKRLWDNVQFFKTRIESLGFQTTSTETPIIPVILRDSWLALRMSEMLLHQGILIQAIRPPAVPEGTSRLRITIMATHTREDLEMALYALEKAGKKLHVI